MMADAPEARVESEYQYIVTAKGPDGQPAEVTFGPTEGAITYNEYWTGPSPWWKRLWCRLTRRA
jgi:hypothetical protein